MILLRRGRTEGGHDCVAGELLDRSAGVGDLGRHRVVEPIEQGTRPLGVLGIRERRRADEVCEEDRCELPLLDLLGRFGDRAATAGAEEGRSGS